MRDRSCDAWPFSWWATVLMVVVGPFVIWGLIYLLLFTFVLFDYLVQQF